MFRKSLDRSLRSSVIDRVAARCPAIVVATLCVSCGANASDGPSGTGGGVGSGGFMTGSGGTGVSGGGPGPGSGGMTVAPGGGGMRLGGGGMQLGMGGAFGFGGALPAGGGGSVAAGGSTPGGGGTAGAAGGAAGASGASGAGGGEAMCVKGKVKGNQVIMIGDSYIQIPGTLEGDIEAHARMEGALGPTETYRNYAVSGTSLGNGQIPMQYETAKTVSKDIKVVLMDGGGNDVLILNSACLSAKPAASNASCVQTVQNAVDTAKKLLDEAGADGVEEVVYFFYPAVPAVTGDILDYSEPKAKAFCDAAVKPRCHFVSTKAAFAGKTGLIGLDNIHPTAQGAQIIADLVWDTMVKNCI